MTALDDLQAYLPTTLATAYGETILAGVLDTEIGDQAARIRPVYRVAATDWDAHAAPLREAVLRRCCRNLAMRKLPLGIAESEANAVRISGRDGEIRRLEAPYLRLVVG